MTEEAIKCKWLEEINAWIGIIAVNSREQKLVVMEDRYLDVVAICISLFGHNLSEI